MGRDSLKPQMILDMTPAVKCVDEGLSDVYSRELISTGEVIDRLLEVRKLVTDAVAVQVTQRPGKRR